VVAGSYYFNEAYCKFPKECVCERSLIKIGQYLQAKNKDMDWSITFLIFDSRCTVFMPNKIQGLAMEATGDMM